MIYPRWSALKSRLQANHRSSLTGILGLTTGTLAVVWRRIYQHIEVAHLWAEQCPNDKRAPQVESSDNPASLGPSGASCYGLLCLSKLLDGPELPLTAIFGTLQVPTSTMMELKTCHSSKLDCIVDLKRVLYFLDRVLEMDKIESRAPGPKFFRNDVELLINLSICINSTFHIQRPLLTFQYVIKSSTASRHLSCIPARAAIPRLTNPLSTPRTDSHDNRLEFRHTCPASRAIPAICQGTAHVCYALGKIQSRDEYG